MKKTVILTMLFAIFATTVFGQANLYRKKAEKGNAAAQYKLGECYLLGLGVTKDMTEAVSWYQKAAEQGHVDAQKYLGDCYMYLIPEKQDHTEAARWYRKAAEQGAADAQFALGNCYYHGSGATKDYTEAAHWFKKAAEQGFMFAQYYLGECYYSGGYGLDKDRNIALSCYNKVLSHEHYKYLPLEDTKKIESRIKKEDNKLDNQPSVAQTEYKPELKDVNVSSSTSSTPKDNQNQNVSTEKIKSDVAVNIPTTNVKNDKTFAVIIANENYQKVSKVDFAKNDGEIFKKYCIQTLGLPEKNVHYIADATFGNMIDEITWLEGLSKAYKGDLSIIFYYAGHGVPDENSKTAYLLPVDGSGSNVRTSYKLDELYQTLGKMPAKNITILMDACFSGAQRSGDMLASARGVAIKVAQGVPVGNMVVFSAAQGDETAYPYKEKGHGLFTYFLLKKLQETKGDVTLGELSDYITTNVSQKAMVENSKEQTPTVMPSAAIGDKWKGLKLK